MADSEENANDENKIKNLLMEDNFLNDEPKQNDSENNIAESDDIRSIKNDISNIINIKSHKSESLSSNDMGNNSKKTSKIEHTLNGTLSIFEEEEEEDEENSNENNEENINKRNNSEKINNSFNDNIEDSKITIQQKKKQNKIMNVSEDDYIYDNFIKIKHCSILKYGIKPSTEKIQYGFCSTCDINLIHPICKCCIDECHIKYNHQTRLMDEPDNIICGCGERIHKFKIKEKKTDINSSIECPYIDWCDKTGLTNLYVIDEICVCEFCYRLCGFYGQGVPLEKEKEMLQICECEEINNGYSHIDLKKIYRKFEELIKKK